MPREEHLLDGTRSGEAIAVRQPVDGCSRAGRPAVRPDTSPAALAPPRPLSADRTSAKAATPIAAWSEKHGSRAPLPGSHKDVEPRLVAGIELVTDLAPAVGAGEVADPLEHEGGRQPTRHEQRGAGRERRVVKDDTAATVVEQPGRLVVGTSVR